MGNYWAGLKGHNNLHPTKAVLQESWEYGKEVKESFGKMGNEVARQLQVFNLKISPTVVYSRIAPWKLV